MSILSNEPQEQFNYPSRSGLAFSTLEPRRQIMQNTTRGKAQPSQSSFPSRYDQQCQDNAKKQPFQPTPKDVPDKMTSRNPFINSIKNW